MKMRINLWCAFALTSLLSLFSFAAQTRAQVHNAPTSPDAKAETPLRRHGPAMNFQVHPDGTGTSNNWGGYVVRETKDSVTNVTGSWRVPTANCTGSAGSIASIWVGIDGDTNSNETVEQIGIDVTCVSGTRTPRYSAWWEYVPNEYHPIALTVNPNDVIVATVTFSGGQFIGTIDDKTTDARIPPIPMTCKGVCPTPMRSSAEWVVEDPPVDKTTNNPFTTFGTTVNFSADSATIAEHSGSIGSFPKNDVFAVTMISNGTNGTPKSIDEASPSVPLTNNGENFSVNTLLEFNARGAGTGGYHGTIPIRISNSGTIAGTYSDNDNVAHGFVMKPDGTPIPLDVGGAGTGNNQGTFALGINTAGMVTGFFSDSSNGYHGFLASSGISPINVDGALQNFHLGTAATSINDSGVITGMYRDGTTIRSVTFTPTLATLTVASNSAFASGQSFSVLGLTAANNVQLNGTWTVGSVSDSTIITASGNWTPSSATPDSGTATTLVHHGFVMTLGGTPVPFDVSEAGTGMYQGTEPMSINSKGVIAGQWFDSLCVLHDCPSHGFVRAANGAIVTFDADEDGCTPTSGTAGMSINTAGTIAGYCIDANGVYHGFTRAAAAPNKITVFDVPGAGQEVWLAKLSALANGPPTQGTAALSINTAGDVAGVYADTKGVYHGFLRTAKGAMLYPINAPGFGTSPMQGTAAISINDRGYVVGAFADTNEAVHGFIAPLLVIAPK